MATESEAEVYKAENGVMVRSSIKEAFSTEPRYTKYIAENEDVATRLLEVVDMELEDDYKIIPEDRTFDGKRVDLIIKDGDDATIAVIEAQDATGLLDSVHTSKITYYCYDKDCYTAILLTEDADEKIKGFVRWLNENTPLNIWLLASLIYKTDNGFKLDFYPIMRPFSSINEKKRKILNSLDAPRFKVREKAIKKLVKENPGLFTNQAKNYVSVNGIKPGLNMAIHPKVNGSVVNFYHAGKFENDEEFKNMMDKFGKDSSVGPNFTKKSCNFSFDNVDEALKYFKIFKDEVKKD